MVAIRRFLKYSMYGRSSSYIVYCPLYGRCPLFGVSAKRGSTVHVYLADNYFKVTLAYIVDSECMSS